MNIETVLWYVMICCLDYINTDMKGLMNVTMWDHFEFSCFYLDSADIFDGFIVALNRWELELATVCHGTNIPGSKFSNVDNQMFLVSEGIFKARWYSCVYRIPKLFFQGIFGEMRSLHVPNSRALFGENGKHLKVASVLRSVTIISIQWLGRS